MLCSGPLNTGKTEKGNKVGEGSGTQVFWGAAEGTGCQLDLTLFTTVYICMCMYACVCIHVRVVTSLILLIVFIGKDKFCRKLLLLSSLVLISLRPPKLILSQDLCD